MGFHTITRRTKEADHQRRLRRVYSLEVEELLEGSRSVAGVAMVGLPDEEFGEQVTLPWCSTPRR
jgi:acyl-CoA synthetase (AMP-forming)/AMP-acid ligase II